MNQKFLEKLQLEIRDKSVNSLISVYPEQLVECLDISKSEVKQLIEDLYKERLLAYKYRIQCLCGNTCTAYARKLQKEPYVCQECGRKYSMDIIMENGTLLYELDKNQILNYGKKDIDFKEESLNELKVVYMKDRKQDNRKEDRDMEIFLGSSSEAICDMMEIGYKLEQLGNRPLPWNASGRGIFPPNSNTIDSLIEITKKVDASVFIFNEDDKIWHHNALKLNKTVRDNVLFEYGLFCGALGKSKVCFVCKGSPTLASDLDGITYIDGNAGEITIQKKLQDWLNAM